MEIIHGNDLAFTVDGRIEEVSSFTYLGEIVTANGGTQEDVVYHIQKAGIWVP